MAHVNLDTTHAHGTVQPSITPILGVMCAGRHFFSLHPLGLHLLFLDSVSSSSITFLFILVEMFSLVTVFTKESKRGEQRADLLETFHFFKIIVVVTCDTHREKCPSLAFQWTSDPRPVLEALTAPPSQKSSYNF